MDQHHHYQLIERAILFLVENYRVQPSLDHVASHVGMSKFHFQRIFTSWVGISPKQFVEHITVDALKHELLKTSSILEASEIVGLSSQSRAYDLMLKIQSMTPGEYKLQGKGLDIQVGIAPTPFGDALVASTQRGVCAFEFIDDDYELILEHIKEDWPLASFSQSNKEAERICHQLFVGTKKASISLLLKGTPFQIKVWSALLKIPSGSIASYSTVAESMGLRSSVRAVASAIAKNPIAYLIPCHRVIRSTGVINHYRWRSERKTLMLGWEFSK